MKIEGLSRADAATKLDVSENTVKTQLSQALTELSTALATLAQRDEADATRDARAAPKPRKTVYARLFQDLQGDDYSALRLD
jgi:hypothetical protein